MWAPLAKAMGRDDMIEDPRYDTFAHPTQNRHEVYQIVDDWVSSRNSVDDVVETMHVWLAFPCDRVNTIEQAVNHPQVKARNLLIEKQHKTLGKIARSQLRSKLFRDTR